MQRLSCMSISRVAMVSLTALLLGCISASSAEANGYVGVGIGSDTRLGGDLDRHFSTDDDSSSRRILIGQRFGFLALEASLFGSELTGDSALVGNDDYSTISLGVDLKFHMGLIAGLEAYGKLGLNRTWLSGPAAREDWDYSGRGNALGVGLQYTFDLPLAAISLWADYTVQRTELRDGERQPLDGELAMTNLGISLGF